MREFTVGDRLTSLLVDLYRPPSTPIVLGPTETVLFRMVNSAGVVKVNNQAAVIVTRGVAGTTPAQVRYDWAAADVDTAGLYIGWFIRVLDGETEHFPPQDRSLKRVFQIMIRPIT